MAATTDARLGLGAAAGVPAAFLVLAGLPYAVEDFTPGVGLDAVWGLGAMFVILLGPVVSGLAGLASLWSLWEQRGAPLRDHRVHLLTLLAVAAFAAVYVSAWGGAVIDWWFG